MKVRITASEVARSFSDVVNRVVYRGEEFIVERNGEAACQITPVSEVRSMARFTMADLNELLRSIPSPDSAFWDDVEEATHIQGVLPEAVWPH